MKQYIVLFLLLIFTNIYSQDAGEASSLLDNQYGFGAKSIAMGGAFTAVSDDYSAVFWNPAGLAQIKKMEFFAGLSHLGYDNNATYLGNEQNSKENFTKLSSIGLVFPIPTYRGSLVFALGYQRVKDFDKTLQFSGFNPNSNDLSPFAFEESNNQGGLDTIDYYFDKNLYQEELLQQDGNLNNWSFAGAIDISPNVSVGATLNFWTGSSDYLFDYFQDDINNYYPNSELDTINNIPINRNKNYQSYYLSQKVLSDYSAFQIKLGALLRQSENLRLGFNISLPYTLTINEQYKSNDNLVFDDGSDDPYEYDPKEFEYDVSLPFQFALGGAYKYNNLTFSVDFEYVDVSQIKFEVPDEFKLSADFDDLLDQNKFIKSEYQEKIKIKAGAEYFWQDQNLIFRGGYMLDPSPLKNAPSDFDKHFITGGLGLIVDKQFLIDLAVMHGSWKKYSADIYTPAGTEEDITYQKIYLTTSFRF